ncbi:MAG: hypothetical protein JWO82_2052 [Akkermansiaceae bacterium]|nr:hypothetical protein [Akkermansiaceae bacterium]
MPQETPAPELETPHETPETAPAVVETTPQLPKSVMVLGGVAVALLAVVLVVSLAPRKSGGKDGSSDNDIKSMQAEIQLLKDNNDRVRAGLGMSPAADTSDIESADKVASRILGDTATLTALARKASEMIGAKDGELAARNKLLNDSQQAQKALSDQIVALRQELNGVNRQNIDASSLQSQLQSAMQKISDLAAQVQDLRQAPVDLQRRLNDATQQRDLFARQVRELQARLAKINIFAGSEADIQKEAQVLYRALLALEGQAQIEISRAYSQYGATLGSTALDRVAFGTGSAELGPDDLDKLKAHVESAPDNAFFFVVGYASKTGSVDDNRKLSSARATAVASALADLKKPAQRVQAAYLGQTDRFGATPPELNQVCELWQIVPRE